MSSKSGAAAVCWPRYAGYESRIVGATATREYAEMADTYTHGHHPSVLKSHTWRTVKNSAAYLSEHLRPGSIVLDVGCGPGNLTADIAAHVAPGQVVGIDAGTEVIAQASTEFGASAKFPVEFSVGDVYALDFADDFFDIVHAHQVLQHLTDPVAALKEMKRVTRPGGMVAARDSDYAMFTWAPDNEHLTRWLEIYRKVARHNNAEPDAGRYLLGWAHAAGFDDVTFSSSTWTFATQEDRDFWGLMWADRILESAIASQAIEYGVCERAELQIISEAFREWTANPDATFIVPHCEIIARA